MKKSILIKDAINQAVKIDHISGYKGVGYLVKSKYSPKKYELLPFDYREKYIFTFNAGEIKHIKLLYNNKTVF